MSRILLCMLLPAMCVFVGGHEATQVKGKQARPTAISTAATKADLGFTAAFEEEVKKVGQITPDEFAGRFPGKAKYLSKISWDPTTAKYWDRFTLDPDKAGVKNFDPKQNFLYDFRPDDKELASSRTGALSSVSG